jgi:hypothetical protein
MTHLVYQLEEHLKSLLANHQYYFKAGDWERVDYIGLCIDDTHEQIEKAKAARDAVAEFDDGDNDEGDYHPYGDPQV